MIRRLALLFVLAAAAAPAAAHAEVGDLAWRGCITKTLAPNESDSSRCPTKVPAAVGGRVVFAAGGTQAYTYSEGVVARHAVNPDGTLSLVDCIRGAEAPPAAAACPVVEGLFYSGRFALSPDEEELYVASAGGIALSALVHFHRDTSTGALTFGSCLARQVPLGACTQNTRINTSATPALTPDSNTLYLPSAGQLMRFTVQPDGTPVFASCHGIDAGCTTATIGGASVKMAGSDVYVGGQSALSHFKRAPDGTLTYVRCYSESPGPFGCPVGLRNAGANPHFSADGTQLYLLASSFSQRAVVLAYRDPATGDLTDTTFCLSDHGRDACPSYRGLGGAQSIAFSPDGAWAYIVGEALTILRRSPDGTLTRIRCIQGRYLSHAGCTRAAPGLGSNAGSDVVLNAAGTRLYYVGFDSVSVFDRVEYVPPAAPDPTPLNEQLGTLLAAKSAPLSAAAASETAATVATAPPPARRAARKPTVSARVVAQTVASPRSRPGAARGSRCAARSRGATGRRAARSGRRPGSCRAAAPRPPCRRAASARRPSRSDRCRRLPSARTAR